MEYENKYNMHTIGKHGPEISDAALKQRAIDGTNPITGIMPKKAHGNPSSQFLNWKEQMHVINEATTRTSRGLSAHTGFDIQLNPIVTGRYKSIGRGYMPNKKLPENPTFKPDLNDWEVKFDKKDPTRPFTAYPTEKK